MKTLSKIALRIYPVAVVVSVLIAFHGYSVQPMPGGLRIVWDKATNDLSFYVWRMSPPSTNWFFLASTTNSSFLYTNAAPDGTIFGVTANQLMTNGLCCNSSDVGVAGWPPNPATPSRTVIIEPQGYLVTTGKWVKVSSDLKTFDDWLRFRQSGSNVVVEHMTSPQKTRIFLAYPTVQTPPTP